MTSPLFWNTFYLLFIILIGFLVIRYDKTKISIRQLVMASVLVAISIVTNLLSVSFYFFGAETIKIGFTLAVLVIAGIISPPKLAFCIGLVVDLVGIMVRPPSMIYLGFTLNNILYALIPSLLIIFLYNKKIPLRTIKNFSYITIAFLTLVSTYYLVTLPSRTTDFEMSRWQMIAALLTLYALVASLYIVSKVIGEVFAHDERKLLRYHQVVLILIIVLSIVSIILTPFHLYIMFEIPMILNISTRIFRDLILLPIYAFLVTIILQVLKFLNYR